MIATSVQSGVLVVDVSAWDERVPEELAAVWTTCEDSPDVKAAIVRLRGEGSIQRLLPRGVALEWASLPFATTKPVVAAIEGQCYGQDFELALSCDVRVAAESAFLGLPNRKAMYSVATVLLPRSTSAGMSLEILLSGRTFSAIELQEARLINRISAIGKAFDLAFQLTADLGSRFAAVGGLQKQLLIELSGLPLPYIMSRVRTPAAAVVV